MKGCFIFVILYSMNNHTKFQQSQCYKQRICFRRLFLQHLSLPFWKSPKRIKRITWRKVSEKRSSPNNWECDLTQFTRKLSSAVQIVVSICFYSNRANTPNLFMLLSGPVWTSIRPLQLTRIWATEEYFIKMTWISFQTTTSFKQTFCNLNTKHPWMANLVCSWGCLNNCRVTRSPWQPPLLCRLN